MAKIRITMEVDTDMLHIPVKDQNRLEQRIRHTVMDALYEFQDPRQRDHGVYAYVEKRYPNYSEGLKEDKVEEVRSRCELAESMRNTVEVETLRELPTCPVGCDHKWDPECALTCYDGGYGG